MLIIFVSIILISYMAHHSYHFVSFFLSNLVQKVLPPEKNILGSTLPVSQLEQGGALANVGLKWHFWEFRHSLIDKTEFDQTNALQCISLCINQTARHLFYF